MIRTIFAIIVAILLVLFQVSFFNAFDAAPYIHFILIATVLIATLQSYRNGFMFAVLSGLLLDLYSPFSFGSITISLLIPIIIIYYLFRKLLAHKSVYTLMLVMAISTLAYHTTFLLLINTAYWFNWNNLTIDLSIRYVQLVVAQLVIHTVLVILLFAAMRFVNRKFRARFFISERI
jgi:hypothetical protein